MFYFRIKILGIYLWTKVLNTKMIICSFVVTIAFPVVLVLESSEIMIVALVFYIHCE